MIERVFERKKNNSKAMLSLNEEKNRGMVRIKERILLTDQTHTEERKKKSTGLLKGEYQRQIPQKVVKLKHLTLDSAGPGPPSQPQFQSELLNGKSCS